MRVGYVMYSCGLPGVATFPILFIGFRAIAANRKTSIVPEQKNMPHTPSCGGNVY